MISTSIEHYTDNYQSDITGQSYFGFPIGPINNIEQKLVSTEHKSVAYFSMEFGIAPSVYNTFHRTQPLPDSNQFFTHEVFSNYWLCDYLFKVHIDRMLDIPIYGGGLGVLAGDTIKSTADNGLNVVAIGILWNKGYFRQRFWYKHGQIPEELQWDPYRYPGLIPLKNIVTIETKEGPLHLQLWKYYMYGHNQKNACPLILLDSNLEQNSESFRRLTDQLYRSDSSWWKILQRLILGVGGMKALESLGYSIDVHHLNEGHAAFALLENTKDKEFVYTCHTPVVAGHDRFTISDIQKIFTDQYAEKAVELGKEKESGDVNLTTMCLNHCSHVNAVAQKHGEVMRLQFPQHAQNIKAITNGIHVHTWISEHFGKLFDRYKDTIGQWHNDQSCLAKVDLLKSSKQFREDIFKAHQANKRNLMKLLSRWQLREDVLTVAWARRMAGYKRPALIFHDTEKILEIAKEVGPLQIIMAGKAHPNDDIGGAHIEEILDCIDRLNAHKDIVKVLILENYDTYFGKLLTSSVDIWLNNPLPPFEASGTSGMKAILNGVVQISTLDGWVVEAADKDIGWIFGYKHEGTDVGTEMDLRLDEDASALYTVLKEAATLYYQTLRDGQLNTQSAWIDKMINAVAQSSFFNTQRMVSEYNKNMWNI